MDFLPVIVVDDICKTFGSKRILNHMSLTVDEGKTFVILGPSGIGKSVTLKTTCGLIRPDSGRVIIAGDDVYSHDPLERRRARDRIDYLFQSGALINWMSVADNIALPLREHTRMSEREVARRVDELLAKVEMLHARDQLPGDISGGMRKRVAFARVMATTPSVVLYDEPTTGLDPIMTTIIADLIRQTQEDFGVTSIVVTHDLGCAYRVADRIGMVRDGRLGVQGTVEEFRASSDPEVQRVLAGEPNRRSEVPEEIHESSAKRISS